MPDIFSAVKSMNLSVDILAYFILFFLIGYFTYAFMYAAFGSTVSKPDEHREDHQAELIHIDEDKWKLFRRTETAGNKWHGHQSQKS